jgi:hypothetical protein
VVFNDDRAIQRVLDNAYALGAVQPIYIYTIIQYIVLHI